MAAGDDAKKGPAEKSADSDVGKRYAKRVKRRIMVKFGTDKPDKTGFTKNLSVTGMFIHTNTMFRPGTTLQVAVHFPDRTFSQWAKVIWGKAAPPQLAHVVECGLGVRFIDPDQGWIDYVEAWKVKLGVQ